MLTAEQRQMRRCRWLVLARSAAGGGAADELADEPVEEPVPESVELVDVCDRLEMASGCCMEWYNADRRKPCEGNIRLG